jgi:type IV secretion system protein VirD4
MPSTRIRGIGTRTVSHSEQVRPLLSPGDVRELPVEDELIFVTGYKPMRVRKAKYYADPMFMKRVLPAPDQSQRLNLPDRPRIDWLHERAKGPGLPLPREPKSSNGAALQQSQADDDDEADLFPDGHVTDV